MFDPFDKQPALLIPILAIVCVTLVFVVWIVSHNWRKARQFDLEAALKKDMLARDFSAADVERVLQASAGRVEPASGDKEPVSDNEYYLVEKMLDEKYPVEEIERLVRAFERPKDERITA
jgi:hypothetical protein